MDDIRWAAFFDELNKIAAATPVREVRSSQWSVKKHRTGRRPISVANLLQKEKDGTLHKGAAQLMQPPVEVPMPGQNAAAARPPRKRGEPRSLEDFEIRKGGGSSVNTPAPTQITGSSTTTRA